MTKEEEIKYASKDYVNYLLDKQEYHNENYTEDDIRQAFEKGVKWADTHSKSLWISIKDNLPKNEIEPFLIYCVAYTKNDSNVENKHYDIYLANFDKENKLCVNIERHNNYCFDVLYWMPIPKLPKE